MICVKEIKGLCITGHGVMFETTEAMDEFKALPESEQQKYYALAKLKSPVPMADQYGFKFPIEELINKPNIVVMARLGSPKSGIEKIYRQILSLRIDDSAVEQLKNMYVIDSYIVFDYDVLHYINDGEGIEL